MDAVRNNVNVSSVHDFVEPVESQYMRAKMYIRQRRFENICQ